MCGIRISNLKIALDLIICYRTPGFILSQDQWNCIVSNVDKNNNCIFLGDFNAHNKNWNCRYTDSNGARLEIAADYSNLFLHNDNTDTHIDIHRSLKSNLDLVFSSVNLSDKIEAKVCDETWGSDHFPIFISVNIDKYFYNKKSFKLKSVRTDWLKFDEELENSLPSIYFYRI